MQATTKQSTMQYVIAVCTLWNPFTMRKQKTMLHSAAVFTAFLEIITAKNKVTDQQSE
jgi:hypothetical protein